MPETERHDAPDRCYSGVTLVKQKRGKIHSVQVIMCNIYLKNRNNGAGGRQYEIVAEEQCQTYTYISYTICNE